MADLGRGDAELLEQLGRECAAVAGGEYSNPEPRPGSVSFTIADGVLRGPLVERERDDGLRRNLRIGAPVGQCWVPGLS